MLLSQLTRYPTDFNVYPRFVDPLFQDRHFDFISQRFVKEFLADDARVNRFVRRTENYVIDLQNRLAFRFLQKSPPVGQCPKDQMGILRTSEHDRPISDTLYFEG